MENGQEAKLYEKLDGGKVRCLLCAHRCVISDGHKGICKVRENRGGVLYTLNYGKLVAEHVDPIEKKPLFHFLPGSYAYSIASPGCNLRCEWCQNWEISQVVNDGLLESLRFTKPEKLVASALRSGCRSIAYTYTEPTIFFEYTLDVSQLAHEKGLKNVYVSNGYMSTECIQKLAPYLDASNIDIKAFDDAVYRKYTGAHLQPVLDSCLAMKKEGIWLEVTTLLIPGVNDDNTQLEKVAEFIASKLGVDTPWHVSRFFPHYHFIDRSSTPLESMVNAIEIGKEAGLLYIYGGNIGGASITTCPICQTTLIERYGMGVDQNRLTAGNLCPVCGTEISGVFL